MSVSSTTNRVGYTGNGAASVYSYTYRITNQSHLLVTVKDTATPPVETTLAITIDYTVSGVNSGSGGNVTLVNSGQSWLTSGNLKSGYALTIRRVVPLTQTTDIRNQGSYLPETHEDEFDKRCFTAQQQQDEIDRSIRLPETISASSFSPTLPTTMASNPGASIIVNDAGNGLTLGIATTLAIARVFSRDTLANLKATAAAAPTTMRFGWATDVDALYFYTGDTTEGDNGWVYVAGAGTAPETGGPI